MTATRAIAVKELRALLPVWAAVAATIVASALRGPSPRFGEILGPAAVVAYTVGTVALGALAAGQDYLFGTLAPALSLPVSRRRVALIKMAVLLPLTASLAAAFLWALRRMPSSREFDSTAFTIAVLCCALSLAPWLTIVTRNLLAGTLFPLSIVALALIGGALAATFGYGLAPGPRADAMANGLFRWAMTVACPIGAVLSWRSFMRLEAIEGPVATVDIGAWRRDEDAAEPVPLRSRPAGAGRRLWLLANKELHLQQLSFALAGLFTVMWAAISFAEKQVVGWREFPFMLAVPLYFGSLSLLIGCLASAEERQMGTDQAQALVPMPMWKQWLVKTGVTLGLGLLLAFLLPAVLLYREGSPSSDGVALVTAVVLLLTAFGMYLSSVTTSGIRAMAYALPAAFVGSVLLQWTSRVVVGRVVPHGAPETVAGAVLVFLGIAAVLVWLAFLNHRTLERRPLRVAAQAAGLLLFALGWMAILDLAAL